MNVNEFRMHAESLAESWRAFRSNRFPNFSAINGKGTPAEIKMHPRRRVAFLRENKRKTEFNHPLRGEGRFGGETLKSSRSEMRIYQAISDVSLRTRPFDSR